MLGAVSFYTTAANAKYTLRIYRLEDGAKVPAYKDPAYRKDGEFPIAGYHTVKLDTPVLLKGGTRFSVVLKMETPDY